ncbi:MAG: sigma factor, partial [Planctomycetota bacterium]
MGDVDLTLTLELVQDAQAGNREALNRLLDRYSNRVRTIIRLRLGSKLRERVDSVDILQETLIEAIQGFDRFEMRDEGSLINWLSKLAERKILNARDFHAALKRDFTRDVAFDAQAEHQMRSPRDTPT